MKKRVLVLFMLCSSIAAVAQTDSTKAVATQKTVAPANGITYGFSFLGDKKTPDATAFLPGPPKETDALYKNDVAMYKWGKSLRGTLRGDTAVWDARTDIPYYLQRFGWAMGKEIKVENCPNLVKLISGALQDIRGGMQKAKDLYARHRPYQVFKEGTSVPQEERIDDYTSYPSGHSVRAWSLAMIFVALDPDHENEIMKTGYDMCESRVIVGFHFQSDVEAARLVASAGFARLCAENSFWAYLQLAREELQQIPSSK